eukprot:m.108849 g.108849  ORF g.108849 m.108849 type:complete len:212 (+) comp27909_c0_seq2:155-790(+)
MATDSAGANFDEVKLEIPQETVVSVEDNANEEISGEMDTGGEIEDEPADDAQGSFGWISGIKKRVVDKKEQAAPWGKFLDLRKASKPKTLSVAYSRIATNVVRFQGNYFLIAVGLMLYCMITSPILIVALAVLMFTGGLLLRGGKDRKILGYTLTAEDQMRYGAILTIPLLWMSAAGGTLFWVIGAMLVLVGIHAAFLPAADEVESLLDLV